MTVECPRISGEKPNGVSDALVTISVNVLAAMLHTVGRWRPWSAFKNVPRAIRMAGNLAENDNASGLGTQRMRTNINPADAAAGQQNPPATR